MPGKLVGVGGDIVDKRDVVDGVDGTA